MSPTSLAHAFRAACLIAMGAPALAAGPADTWPVIGQQGLAQFVLVPTAQAADQAAYLKQIDKLCEPERTCFLSFYTNSTGATPAVPLPDAIANEATATFRRSAKQGAEQFMWSCRMKLAVEQCF